MNTWAWSIGIMVTTLIVSVTYYNTSRDPRAVAMERCVGVFGDEQTRIACARAIFGSEATRP